MESNYKIAIVISTYNGEKFILSQLDSILNQTYNDFDVYIFDDCSTDNTVNCVNKFILENNLKRWNVFVNENNKGWKRNFFESFMKTDADIIFSCDQDDIWFENKLESMINIFENNNSINVLFSGYEPFYCNVKTNISLREKISLFLDKLSHKRINKNNNRIVPIKPSRTLLKVIPGCNMAFRKKYLNYISKLWKPIYGHDAFLLYYSLLDGSCYRYQKNLMKWRQYSGSTSKPQQRKKNIRINELNRDFEVLNDLLSYNKEKRINKYLTKLLSLNNLRKRFFETKNIFYGLYLFRYIFYYERKRSLITDWLYCFRGNNKNGKQ